MSFPRLRVFSCSNNEVLEEQFEQWCDEMFKSHPFARISTTHFAVDADGWLFLTVFWMADA